MRKLCRILGWILRKTKPYGMKLALLYSLNVILSLSGVGAVIFIKEMVDSATEGNLEEAIHGGIFLLGIIALQLLLDMISSLWRVRIVETMTNDMKEDVYVSLIKSTWNQLTKYHSGDIVSRLSQDGAQLVSGVIDGVGGILSLGTSLIAAFLLLYAFDSFLALFAILFVPILMAFSGILGRKFVRTHQAAKIAESKAKSFMQESIEHLLVIKAFCYEKQSVSKLKELQEKRSFHVIQSNRVGVSVNSLISSGYWISYFVAFAWGAVQLSYGTASFGTFTAFVQLVGQVQQPLMGIGQFIPELLKTMVSAKRLMEIENLDKESEEESIKEKDFDHIALEDLSFAYKAGQWVLKHLDIEVHQGDIIGLVGASGCGKTTLLHVLMSLQKPQEGRIRIYQNQIWSVVDGVRKLVSYVPQGNTLFSGTISDNLLIGNENASIEEQIEALKAADAWGFIEELPNGIHTEIGERGIGLSEGQSQRISIARAILKKGSILILDEATSALDMDTEQRILENILQSKERTCIVVTHRLAALEYCNRIWNIIDGRINETEIDHIELRAANE